MWPRRSVSVVATASAAIVMTSLAGCSGSAEPPVTAWTLLVAPQRQILRSVISLGRSVRGRPIRAIVCSAIPTPPAQCSLLDASTANETAGMAVADRARCGATAQRIGDLDHPRSQSRRCRRRHTAKRSPRRSQSQLPVRMAAARSPRRPTIRRTAGTLRARESRRTHADHSPPASAHNLVSSAGSHHRSIRRRRPN
jgi:hypothetical protein